MVLVSVELDGALSCQGLRKDRQQARRAARREPNGLALRAPSELIHLQGRRVHWAQAELRRHPEIQDVDLVGAIADRDVLRRGRPTEAQELLQRGRALLQVDVIDRSRGRPCVKHPELAGPPDRCRDEWVLGIALGRHPIAGPRALLLAARHVEQTKRAVLVAGNEQLVTCPIQRVHAGSLLTPEEVVGHCVRHTGGRIAEGFVVEPLMVTEGGVDQWVENVTDVR
mmetsp:Transcript_128103/g.370829  ORF Transcript_128103/g.370829 Transcript_128103/m.370829 type:complete len:226 (-) Transcript_128103:49-726(-)